MHLAFLLIEKMIDSPIKPYSQVSQSHRKTQVDYTVYDQIYLKKNHQQSTLVKLVHSLNILVMHYNAHDYGCGVIEDREKST